MALPPSAIARCPSRLLLSQCAPPCLRTLTTSACLRAGHNKWSKIRHEKGAADRKRSTQNIILAKAITDASRKGGPNYKDGNPALAAAVSAAKAANVTSAFIERAIARGQARSLSGAALEKLTVEAVLPGNVALILDVETDSRLRSLQDLNSLVKKSGGKPGSTLFYFEHRGRVVLALDERSTKTKAEWEEEVMGAVLEEDGVLDVDVEGGEVTVWTEAAGTGAVVAAVKERLGVEPRSVDLVWRAKEDMKVSVDSKVAAEELGKFFEALEEYPEVTASYINAEKGEISEEAWARIQDNLILP
ncbi:hypothetical protein jhhlp_000277 [Lomentospora prolificans]|uniref:Transcriptional regulatory protein n=1 Tax=Lomentospora prolificans TaxID=41688 RepID=A0A2N3NKD9_9PEZI|nr:hypothetical protein jhhlp_000277 [Lomentospora prolificans]